MHYYPNNVSAFDNLDAGLQKLFFRDFAPADYLADGKPVITQGSCFAANFAKALVRESYPTAHLFVNEWVNSTHANAVFFNYMTSDHYAPVLKAMGLFERQVVGFLRNSLGDSSKAEFVDTVKACGVFVLTIGVAPLWYSIKEQTYCMSPDKAAMHNFCMKTTDVASNAENIRYIISRIRSLNETIKIYVTLSPAPLNATDEFPSVFEADCVSKSTLRLAIHDALEKCPDVTYWPSFEIVRWLGSHTEPVYGDDDGHPRHVSNWLVDKIVRAFVRLNGGSLGTARSDSGSDEEPTPFKLARNF
jgi:hypothetical protein